MRICHHCAHWKPLQFTGLCAVDDYTCLYTPPTSECVCRDREGQRVERYKAALEEIATGTSGAGAATDLAVCRTIARRALGHLQD